MCYTMSAWRQTAGGGLCFCVQVREQKGIAGTFVSDLLTICCCYCCALTQEAQEVAAIGNLNMVRQ